MAIIWWVEMVHGQYIAAFLKFSSNTFHEEASAITSIMILSWLHTFITCGEYTILPFCTNLFNNPTLGFGPSHDQNHEYPSKWMVKSVIPWICFEWSVEVITFGTRKGWGSKQKKKRIWKEISIYMYVGLIWRWLINIQKSCSKENMENLIDNHRFVWNQHSFFD